MKITSCRSNLHAGPTRGGIMTPGPMDFRGPMGFRRAHWLQGAQQRAHRNGAEKSACENQRPFFFEITSKFRKKRWHFSLKTAFFLRSHQNPEKTVAFFLEDLFFLFGDQNSDKTVAFSPSVLEFTKPEIHLFELAPDRRSALGAPEYI